MPGVRSTALVLTASLLVAGCGGEAVQETTVPTTRPPASTNVPTTATTSAPSTTEPEPATTTTAAVTTPPTEPTIEIIPAAAPSGTRFMVHGTGCGPDSPSASVEAYISVEWIDGPQGVEAHNVPVAEDGSWVEELASSDWLHWVVGADGHALYNGLGANPGTYRVSAGCRIVTNDPACTAPFTYPDQFFTITDEPPVYLVDGFSLLPDVLAAPGDTEYRDLTMTLTRGSGCAVAGTELPDGVWFGYLRTLSESTLGFDLACFFAENSAYAAAAADGGSVLWVPVFMGGFRGDHPLMSRIGVYVRNRNPLVFSLPIDPQAEVWRLITISGTAFVHTPGPLDPWLGGQSSLQCPGPACSVWLYVNGGQVTAIVEQYLPPPSTITATASIADRVAAEWPPSWLWGKDRAFTCHAMTLGPVAAGSVVSCQPVRAPADDLPYPAELTILVLDDAGTLTVLADTPALAVPEAGIYEPGINAVAMEYHIDPGLGCTDLLAWGSFLNLYAREPLHRYLGVVLYWFIEGRPDRLDADGNGRPCEAEFAASVDAANPGLAAAMIDEVWAGGWIGGSP